MARSGIGQGLALQRVGCYPGDQEHLRRRRTQQRHAPGMLSVFIRFLFVLGANLVQINNSAPSHETLGTLNGIAQSLSAAGRSVGPFLSGGLFTLSRRVRPKGEALAWGLFAGIALLGWAGTLTIRGSGLESADWMGNDDDDESTESADDETAVA